MSYLSGPALAVLALLPLAVGATAPGLGGYAARKLPPDVAAVLLTALALTVALVSGMLLCLAAVVALAKVPGLHGLGHWSPRAVQARVPVPVAAGIAGGAIACVLLVRAGVHLARLVAQARLAAVAAASMPATEGLVVVREERPFAYAVPGRYPRIVVSTGMLGRLTPLHRRVLLAHEAAHLRHRHHYYVQLGRLAAAANPLLRPVSAAIDLAVERWADESAALEVGDRPATARALVAAASAQSARPDPGGVLPAARTHLPARVACLLDRRVRHRLLAAALIGAAIASWIAGYLVIEHIHALMELSESH